MNRAENPDCVYCPEVWNDAEHTLLRCPHFREDRTELEKALVRTITPEDIGRIMCGDRRIGQISDDQLGDNLTVRDETCRKALVVIVEGILRRKRKEPGKRKRDSGGEEEDEDNTKKKTETDSR